jgi:hypothetical protein
MFWNNNYINSKNSTLKIYFMKKTILLSGIFYLTTLTSFAANVISNGDFELNTNLNASFFTARTTAPGVQTLTVDAKAPISGLNSLKVDVKTSGVDMGKLAFAQSVSLAKGASYTVSFKAKASVPVRILTTIAQSYAPWTYLYSEYFELTTNVQTFSYTVKSADASGLCRLMFNYGAIASGASLVFDDISIVETTNPLSAGNLCNGDFETDLPNAIYNSPTYTNALVNGWTKAELTNASPSMNVVVDDKKPISGTKSLKVIATGSPSDFPESKELAMVWLFAGVKDAHYTVSFKAKASAPCTIGLALQAWAWTSKPSCDYISEKPCNLTTAVQTFSFDTTAPFLNPDGRNLLKFLLGKLPNGVSVWIDDVVVAAK